MQTDLGNRANVLRVSIHTDLGRELATRYRFAFTPLFVVLDSSGNEVWRGSFVPAMEKVLSGQQPSPKDDGL